MKELASVEPLVAGSNSDSTIATRSFKIPAIEEDKEEETQVILALQTTSSVPDTSDVKKPKNTPDFVMVIKRPDNRRPS
eukprot:TRINITY_DN3884_c0_g1_i1.p1 TRINITY_DN3884_c0_g1~~TRINITY_DN3884_c0_g1_i1.p1  ORF type:complete len:79 (+),score=11.46 TRINITY_DN3884_c0_g1_i1:158-394(+)